LKKELGDVCWALCRLADDLGFDMEDILQYNHDKLMARKAAGTIQGSGDDR
jgi:NTP pyrophosphatase (non-canonical NTP hydrolase)